MLIKVGPRSIYGVSDMNKSANKSTNKKSAWQANFNGANNCGNFVHKKIPAMR